MRRMSIMTIVWMLTAQGGSAARGAGHPEITVIPLGGLQLKTGAQEVVRSLPAGSRGVLPQPLVLIAAQPHVAIAMGPEKEGAAPTGSGAPETRSVAATLKIRVGDRQLPDWKLEPARGAYVIDLETIRQNPDFASGRIKMTIEMIGEAEQGVVALLGMPDPLLLNDGSRAAVNGSLSRFIEAAGDEAVRAYFTALSREIAGEQEAAKAGYEELKASSNRRVARFARRGLRMLSYQLRKRRLSGNFMEHYRWGLYLQACGFFKAAYEEFEECRIIDPGHGESQYRAAECLERIGAGLMRTVHYIDRTGEASKVNDPTIWYALVTILKSRKGKSLTPEQVDVIKDNWHFAEKMLRAASDGEMRIATSFHEIENERAQDYTLFDGRVTGPADDIIEVRGWYDSVISVRPRLDGEEDAALAVAGADAGPNGTAIASVYHDAGWGDYLRAIYGHLRWAAETSEASVGLPSFEDALDCGSPPVSSPGAAYRGALRHHFSRVVFRRLNMNEVPVPGSYVQLWKVEGPFAVEGGSASGTSDRPHVLDSIPPGTSAETRRIVSDADFIDLAALFPKAGWALARATSWVFSPTDQRVQMNLGRNDAMALWLNGRRVLAGRAYASGRFRDQNRVDTICTSVEISAGWNEFVAVVESRPAPDDRGWGFSISLTTKEGQPVPGLASVYEKPQRDLAARFESPKAGGYFTWSKVKSDFRRQLPLLSEVDLRALTKIRDLTLQSSVREGQGFVALVTKRKAGRYRAPPATWQPDRDRDVRVNNLMDWARESCAVIRCQAKTGHRDLLLLKPEAVEAFLTILNEPESAKTVFGGTAREARVWGRVVVPAGASTRSLLVLDARLTDGPDWPADEEDLLTPYGEFVPNWPMEQDPTTQPAPPPETAARADTQ